MFWHFPGATGTFEINVINGFMQQNNATNLSKFHSIHDHATEGR